MNTSNPKFKKHIFVCENQRESGACCGSQGAEIREALKKRIKEKGASGQIRVCRSGCLDVCSEGPNVLLMPDNAWFKGVSLKDVEEIVRLADSV